MDEILLKQLIRQIKILNIWVSIFGTFILVSFVALVVIGFKVVSYVHDTTDRITALQTQAQQNLDLKTKICNNKSAASFLGATSDICK